MTGTELEDLRSYLRAFPAESLGPKAVAVPSATLPRNYLVRPDSTVPAPPPWLEDTAQALLAGDQTLAQRAVVPEIVATFNRVWAGPLAAGCEEVTRDPEALTGRIVTPRYCVDIGGLNGRQLAVLLACPVTLAERTVSGDFKKHTPVRLAVKVEGFWLEAFAYTELLLDG